MNPSDQTEKNIRCIYDREKAEQLAVPKSSKFALAIAAFSGTVAFAVCNAIFFAAWMIVNITFWKFDPYPFTLLLMMVSLESIFLSVFVLISQNQMSDQQDRRNKLDLQVNLLSEQEATELIRVVILIAKQMGIDNEALQTIEAMAEDTSPEEVLQKIDAIEKENP